jgi:hypothetical protein
MLERSPQIRTYDRAPAREQVGRDHRPEPAQLLEPCPCQGCWHASRCGSEHLACEPFALFLQGVKSPRWRLMKRSPSRELYQVLLGDDG